MKKNDFILVGIITILCILSICLFRAVSAGGAYVIIKYDNAITGTYILDKDTSIRIPQTGDNYNIVEIKNKQVYISDADCPDLICKNHSAISRSGESIICLPHKLSVIIVDDAPETGNTFDAISE